jgi:hypothetical protein
MANQSLAKSKKAWYQLKKRLDYSLWFIGRNISKPIEAEEYELVAAPEVVVKPPANMAMLPDVFKREISRPLSCPGQIIYQLRDANVAWHGSVVKGLRVFVPSLPYPFLEPELSGTFLLRQFARRKKPELSGVVGLVFDQWSIGNYFHWMAEVLPRLALLRKFQPDCTVLVPGPKPHEFIIQTVRAFGFDKIHVMSPGEILQIPNLLVAALPGSQGYITPSLVRESRDTVLSKLVPRALIDKKATRRIYVSRSLQSWRQLTNEAEVVALLTEYGFETVYFEKLSFVEQVCLMQETKVFIGIHGANMTNVLYMPVGGHVVEILSDDYINLSYLYMSNSAGLNYYIVPSTVSSPPEVFHTYADIITDVNLVEAVIKPICEIYS